MSGDQQDPRVDILAEAMREVDGAGYWSTSEIAEKAQDTADRLGATRPASPAPTSLGDWCNCQGGPQGPWHPLGDTTCAYAPADLCPACVAGTPDGHSCAASPAPEHGSGLGLPSDPDELISLETRAATLTALEEMARVRRSAEVRARDLPVGFGATTSRPAPEHATPDEEDGDEPGPMTASERALHDAHYEGAGESERSHDAWAQARGFSSSGELHAWVDARLAALPASAAPDREEALIAAILDIDAHATGLGEDGDGFVTGGYVISVGSLHRALGLVGHTPAS